MVRARGLNPRTLLYLARDDVVSTGLPMREIIAALEEMFRARGRGEGEMPPKPGIHPRPDAFIHAMPAYLPDRDAAGIKWVAGYSGNPGRGLPYVSGLIVLNDAETGIPIAVMDATWITAMRTGAATAVAAKHLARPDSSSVGIVACGTQGRSNLEALSCVFALTRVKAYDIDRQAALVFADEMSRALDIEIEVVTQLRDAVADLDLVVTSGPILERPSPAIEAGWLAPGSFGCALDFDSYWQGAALREVDKLATDDRGQLDYYRQVGFFGDTPQPYADLGEIVSGSSPGRESAEERTLSLNLGLALADVTTAALVVERAARGGLGTELRL